MSTLLEGKCEFCRALKMFSRDKWSYSSLGGVLRLAWFCLQKRWMDARMIHDGWMMDGQTMVGWIMDGR